MLLLLAERHHDGDDLMRRRVKGHEATALTNPDLVQLTLVGPRPMRADDRGAEVPGSRGWLTGGVVAAENHASAPLGRFETRKHQPVSLERHIDRLDREPRGLAQPDALYRKEGILP